MARRSYTDEQRAEALALYVEAGPTAVQAQLGIPKQTVQQWAAKDGLRTVRNERMAEAVEAVQVDAAARRAIVQARLWQIAEEASAIELTKLADADLRSVVGARTRAIHDAQLLGGDPTSRNENVNVESLDREIERLMDLAAS